MADTALATTNDRLPEVDAFASMIERAAENPNVDADKMIKLYELHERMQREQARKAFFSAMTEMQDKLPVIEHTKTIGYTDKQGKEVVKGTYTPWEDIDEQIRPIYTAHGFSLRFTFQRTDDGWQEVTANVMHEMGHSEATSISLPPDPSGKKNNIQAVGSSSSYGKRYAACAAFNITTRGADDDGEAAGQPMTAHMARKEALWTTLTDEMKQECATRQELRDWWQRTNQHRMEWHSMPNFWKALFKEEVFVPYSEDLPERLGE